MAATVPVEKKGDPSPLLEAAQMIGLEGAEQTMRQRAPGKPAANAEPAAGSYERFLNSFGNPSRWGAR